MTHPDLDRAKLAMQVRWDVARERRVLSRTVDRFEARTRRRRTLSWAIAAAVVLLLFRLLPSFGAARSDSGGVAGAGATSGGRTNRSGTGGTAGTG
jgi:hypothetical protein